MERTLIFLLDRSGSMEICRDDTIGGFNSFVSDQKTIGGRMTLVQFDHEIQEVYTDMTLDKIDPLTARTYSPRGSTALLDAIGKTIKKHTDKTGVVFIIQTDGQENGSTTYTRAHVKDLVEQKTADGWVFMYLGANQDAFTEAGGLGLAGANTFNYDVRNTPGAFRALSQTVSQQASI